MQLDELINLAREKVERSGIKIYGFCGRIGAGKTTAENFLIKNGFIEMSFAEPLKKAVSIIFGFDYSVLLGKTKEARDERENIKHPVWGKTGREMLEIIGTDVMRNNFDNDIWIKSLLNRICDYDLQNIRGIVIADCRFQNEMDVLLGIGGKLVIVYKNISDLTITDEDRKTHISRWGFLQCNMGNPIHIENSGTIEEFEKKIGENLL